MRACSQIAAVASFLAPAMILFSARTGAETIDRIAVTVGTHVIAESEIIADIRISAFLDEVPAVITGSAKRKAADRLIDQYLVLQDATLSRAPLPAAADVAPLIAPIRARYPTDRGYEDALAHAGITEDELTAHLLAGLQMLRYSDLRFRPEVQLSDQDLHDYYDRLKAELGPTPPSFEEAQQEVEQLMTGERTLRAMDRWLGMTRAETTILYRDEAFQ
jgi:hypothetical protein